MESTIYIKKMASLASDSMLSLKKVYAPVRRWLAFSAADIFPPAKSLCISLEKGMVSAAYGSEFLSKITIKGFKKYPLREGEYPQVEDLASIVPLASTELKAEKADITLTIPKEWVVIKRVKLPLAAEENLQEVVSYELDRLTPFSSEEAYYDYRIISADDSAITALLAAARAGLINKYLEALRDEGINVGRVSVDIAAAGSLCRYMGVKRDTIFLEIDRDGYEGALLNEGVVTDVFTGIFPEDSDSLKAEQILSGITAAGYYGENTGLTPDIMVSLKNAPLSLVDALKVKINLPLKVLGEADIKLRVPGDKKDIPFTAAGGVSDALWKGGRGLNLLRKGQYEKTKTPLFITALLLLLIAALAVFYIFIPLQTEQKRLIKIDNEMSLKKKDAVRYELLRREIEGITKENSVIKKFRESRPAALGILKEFTTVLPPKAWLTKVRISETTVELEGYAESATGLLPKLEASKYFKKVGFISPVFKDVKKGVDRFSIKMEIEGAKEIEINKEEEPMEGSGDDEI